MHVGELAQRTGLSIRTIRHYDEVGLLIPSGRTAGGFRLYTESDHARALLVKAMKPLGYSLEEMKVLVDVIDRLTRNFADADAQQQLARLVDEAMERRDNLQKNLAVADGFIRALADYRAQ